MNNPTPEEFRAIRKATILREMREWIAELQTPRDDKDRFKKVIKENRG